MFIHEAVEKLKEGKKVGRMAWPKGDHLRQPKSIEVELDESELRDCGLKANAQVSIADGTYLYVADNGARGAFGYVPDFDDRNCSDWYVL
jgi:hypothetical protein